MEFEWDDAKSDSCFADRGFDFEYVAHAFLDEDRTVAEDSAVGLRRGSLPVAGRHRGSGVRGDLHHAGRDDPHHFRPQGQPQGGSGV